MPTCGITSPSRRLPKIMIDEEKLLENKATKAYHSSDITGIKYLI
jgi:hypothetical protein